MFPRNVWTRRWMPKVGRRRRRYSKRPIRQMTGRVELRHFGGSVIRLTGSGTALILTSFATSHYRTPRMLRALALSAALVALSATNTRADDTLAPETVAAVKRASV